MAELPKFLSENNPVSSLAAALSAVGTTITLAAGGGALFPVPVPDQYMIMTLSAPTGVGVTEIVKVTNRTTDTLTVVRAQEGTAAAAWPIGTIIEMRLTAGQVNNLLQNPLTLPLIDVELEDGEEEIEIDLAQYDGLPFLFLRLLATEVKILTDITGLTRGVTQIILQVAETSTTISIEQGAPFLLSDIYGSDVGWPGFPGSTITLASLPSAPIYKLVETARAPRTE